VAALVSGHASTVTLLHQQLDPELGICLDNPHHLRRDRRLYSWAVGNDRSPADRPPHPDAVGGALVAFYGRASTPEFQHGESSLGWQRGSAIEVIAGRGRIAAEFFDIGYSRRGPWAHRREAVRLLQAVTSPDRGFDAIIVGESERAFTGTQLVHLAPIFLAHGVQAWLPELDGPADLTDPAHQALILRLGERARREVARVRHRTTAAMRVQARGQGRYLGGHPPYGYRLVDAGPGRRQQGDQLSAGREVPLSAHEEVAVSAHTAAIRWGGGMFRPQLASGPRSSTAPTRHVICSKIESPVRSR
jgi:DNA invertase Pin-like site-specific DNA recombinase